MLRAGKVPGKHIVPPAPKEGENYQMVLTYPPWEPPSLVPSREVPLSPLPQTSFHSLQHLSGIVRRVSQRRGWQLEAYVLLRERGGRSTQAAVAGGEMAGEGSTEAFWCCEVPRVQRRWAKPCWRGCCLGACVASGLRSCCGSSCWCLKKGCISSLHKQHPG